MAGFGRFAGGVDVEGAGSIAAEVATTAGTGASATDSSGFAFRFFARRRLFFFPLLSIVFLRDETPRDV